MGVGVDVAVAGVKSPVGVGVKLGVGVAVAGVKSPVGVAVAVDVGKGVGVHDKQARHGILKIW